VKNRKLAVRTFYNINGDIKAGETALKDAEGVVTSTMHSLNQAKAEQRKDPCDFNAAKVQKCSQEYDTALVTKEQAKVALRALREEMRLFVFHQKGSITGKGRTLRA
jgi:hypothetical protein